MTLVLSKGTVTRFMPHTIQEKTKLLNRVRRFAARSFVGSTSQSPQKIDAIRTTGGPFREAKDSRIKQTRERLDACRETSDVCVCPEKGAGQT